VILPVLCVGYLPAQLRRLLSLPCAASAPLKQKRRSASAIRFFRFIEFIKNIPSIEIIFTNV
jgi:hypothetical protein